MTPPFRFLFAGRLDRNKNVACAVKALGRLRAEGGDDVELWICGDGEERQALERLTIREGLSGRVRFLGYVDHEALRRIYARATALLLPSFSEMLPKVVVEAFASGVPVIASRVNGTEDLITEGRNGYFVDPRSPESMARAMRTVVERDEATYEAMAREALATARRFSGEAVLEAWVGVIDEMIERGTGGGGYPIRAHRWTAPGSGRASG